MARPREHVGAARGAARVGAAGRAARRSVPGHRRRHRLLPRVGRPGASSSSSTPTASSSSSTISRCASGSAARPSSRAGRRRSSSPRSSSRPRLLRIEVNVGRTGADTPYAVLEPVFVAGSTVSMATLAQRRGHRAQGSARRRHRHHRKGRRRHPASRRARAQPAAGRRDAVGDADDVQGVRQSRCKRDEEEVVWRCENASCPARLRRSLEHFAVAHGDEHRGARRIARRSADRAGARPRLRRSVSASSLSSSRISSSLRESRARRAPWRESSARSGETSSARSSGAKQNDLSRLVFALGIRHVGEKAAATLSRAPADDGRRLSRRRSNAPAVPDIGPVVAASVRIFADEPQNRALIDRLAAAGREHGEPAAAAERRRARTARRARPSCSPARSD